MTRTDGGGSTASGGEKVTEILSADLGQAHEILTAVRVLSQQTDDVDRQLFEETQAHLQAKERVKALQEEHRLLLESLEHERSEAQRSKGRMAEMRAFQAKSGAALKAMAEDLMAVRLQNEALQAEMDVQRKAFVVSVNWAQVHAELKAKYDALLLDREQIAPRHAQLRQSLDAAVEGRDAAKEACARSSEELERARDSINDAARCEALAAELAEQMGGYEALRRHVQEAVDRRKKLRQSARAAIQKSLCQGDQACVGLTFSAWKRQSDSQKLAKQKKQQSTGLAMRAIANSNAALQDFALTAWAKEVEEVKRQRLLEANRALEGKNGQAGQQADAARRKALAQLERQFGNAAKALTREVFAKWQVLRHERTKRERAHAIAARNIASSGQMILQQATIGWIELWRVAKHKREKKAAGQARAMRLIADGSNALMDFCLTQWAALTKQALATKKAKEGGEKKALRMIASTQDGVKAQVFHCWHDLKKKKDEQARKMKAVEKGLVSSGTGMLQYIVHNWHLHLEKKKKSDLKKEHGMKQSAKKIKNLTYGLLMECVLAWSGETIANRHMRLEEQMEAKRKAAAVPDDRVHANEAETQNLGSLLEKLRAQYEEMQAKLAATEAKSAETGQQVAELERQLSRDNDELSQSRRKAKDINEELSRVSAFLNKPRKPASRPGSGVRRASENNGLPPLAGPKTPNSARGPGGRTPDLPPMPSASPGPAAPWNEQP